MSDQSHPPLTLFCHLLHLKFLELTIFYAHFALYIENSGLYCNWILFYALTVEGFFFVNDTRSAILLFLIIIRYFDISLGRQNDLRILYS